MFKTKEEPGDMIACPIRQRQYNVSVQLFRRQSMSLQVKKFAGRGGDTSGDCSLGMLLHSNKLGIERFSIECRK